MKSPIQTLQPYTPEAPAEVIKATYQLTTLARLSANESVFGPSPCVADALTAVAREAFSIYPDGQAVALREALCTQFDLEPNQIVVGNGADELIGLISRVFLTAGSQVITPTPTFGAYKAEAAVEGASVCAVPVQPETGATDFAGMLAAISPATSLIWLVNPNNPTGVFEPLATITRFLDQVPRTIPVVIDEAYYDFVAAANATALPLITRYSNVIVLRTLSKAYGAANLRIGWLATNTTYQRYLEAIRPPYNLSNFQIAAGQAAVQDQAYLAATVPKIQAERAIWLAWLTEQQIPHYISEANFIFINTPDAKAVGTALLAGGIQINYRLHATWVRISIGFPKDNARARTLLLNAIKKAN